jgi:hypothetical protein
MSHKQGKREEGDQLSADSVRVVLALRELTVDETLSVAGGKIDGQAKTVGSIGSG